MSYNIIILMLACSLSWGQGLAGLAGKAKAKLEAVENDIKATYQLLEIETTPEFEKNSTKHDLTKRILTSPDRKLVYVEEMKVWKLLWLFPIKYRAWEVEDNKTADDIAADMISKKKVKHQYTNFGDIGKGVTINNLSQSFLKEDISKSSFWNSSFNRFYSFEVTEGSQNTVCECTAETSRKVYWPLFFKNRGMFLGPLSGLPDGYMPNFWSLMPWNWFKKGWNPVRDLTQNLNNSLSCTIYNGSNKYEMNLEYNEYKVDTDHTIAQKLIKKLLPKAFRDNGERFELKGTIKNDNSTYLINTNYDYDFSVLTDNSPFRVLTPPVSYTVLNQETGKYAAIKNPSHFQISSDYENSNMQGILYGAILSAYFYKPLGGKGDNGIYESNQKLTGEYKKNIAASANQTVTYKSTTKKGAKIAKASNKRFETEQKMAKAQGTVAQKMSGFGGEKEKMKGKDAKVQKGWENERYHLDVFYNASIRGPLGLY